MTSHMNPLSLSGATEAVPLGAAPAEDVAARVARLGALPQAPLAMPKQKLEHDGGLLRRILRLSHVGAARTEG